MQDDEFFCPNCGKVSPSAIWYTFPTTFKCPTCSNIFEGKQQMQILSQEEAIKMRPGLKKSHEVSHCGMKNGKTIEVGYGDKVGFVCETCKKVFEINYEGKITESPLGEEYADYPYGRK